MYKYKSYNQNFWKLYLLISIKSFLLCKVIDLALSNTPLINFLIEPIRRISHLRAKLNDNAIYRMAIRKESSTAFTSHIYYVYCKILINLYPMKTCCVPSGLVCAYYFIVGNHSNDKIWNIPIG